MDSMTEQLREAWGCPVQYRRVTYSRRRIDPGANWYPELSQALGAMVDAGDAAAIEEWANSPVWDEIAVETAMNGDVGSYADDVRQALLELADSVGGG
ncbi:MAG: hypothetical protein ACRD1R_09055 [Acidobacteriota bacterium]